MLQMDSSPLPIHLPAFRIRPPPMSGRTDSSLNAANDTPGSDPLRDRERCPQCVPVPADLRCCLPLSRVQSQIQRYRLSWQVHAIVKSTHEPDSLNRQMNPFLRDKRFEWNPRSTIPVSLR